MRSNPARSSSTQMEGMRIGTFRGISSDFFDVNRKPNVLLEAVLIPHD
jgi:hypothetical protein